MEATDNVTPLFAHLAQLRITLAAESKKVDAGLALEIAIRKGRNNDQLSPNELAVISGAIPAFLGHLAAGQTAMDEIAKIEKEKP